MPPPNVLHSLYVVRKKVPEGEDTQRQKYPKAEIPKGRNTQKQKYPKAEIPEVHPAQLSDGTLSTYAFRKISFGHQNINAQAANATTTPTPLAEASTQAVNTITTPNSEWVHSTKRAIEEISKEIKQLKKRQRYLKKALK
ncbi:hypothetical protein MAM1_0058d03692 [Mucor ambiguus]|uniref:Uncharacterized protein n=1 Tax=Mucor ambiguus TaxID=91626 RepID=A0A0C9MM86_9FUNG|nr:hypothetical protein MAM1_0058d03692 [Mucor ambiguus]